MPTLSAETERLIFDSAAAAGKSPDAFVRDILAAAKPKARGTPIDIAKVDEISRRHLARPVIDPRRLREIVDEINALS